MSPSFEFRILTQAQARPLYRELWRSVRKDFISFPGFDFFHQKLFSGSFAMLRNRYASRVLALLEDGRPVAMATHLRSLSPSWGEPHALGAVLIRGDATDAALDEFHRRIGEALGSEAGKLVGPINGHMALGTSLPDPGVDGRRVSFLTSSATPALKRFFYEGGRFRPVKRYFALTTSWSAEMEARLREEIADRPAGLSTRPISLPRFKRDIAIYTRLVNACMTEHPRFHPLAEAEDWDLMRLSLSVIHRDYFRFLVQDGREIGYCFGIPDYNPHLRVGASDAENTVRVIMGRNRARKGRIIYSGILPEFRGSRLFKHVRHEVLLAMFANGIREVESSYVDELNDASLGNVRSTGATVSHSFSLHGFVPKA